MIYIWHNQSSGQYELGDEGTYILETSIHETTLLYEFSEGESHLAQKIHRNLSRAAMCREAAVI